MGLGSYGLSTTEFEAMAPAIFCCSCAVAKQFERSSQCGLVGLVSCPCDYQIRDDVEIPPSKAGKPVQQATSRPQPARANSGAAIQELAQPSLNRDSTSDRFQLPATIIHSIIAETTNDVSS